MQHITKCYPGVLALDDVHFELEPGEVHVLIGENGAGKSTLMKILSGAERKDAGDIFIEGNKVEITSPRDAKQLGIMMIYQELNLVPQLSVAENILLGKEPMNRGPFVDWKTLYSQARALLDRLGSDLTEKAKVSGLSIAQQQVVEIAKALSSEAKIMVMDEPSAALTTKEVADLFKLIRWLKAQGISVIYISHRLEELFEIGDNVTVLRDGKWIDTKKVSEVDKTELIRKMVGRELTQEFPKRQFNRGREVLRVEHINRNDALHDISFSLYQGELLGIAGLVGAGRTELARVIFGADRKDSGDMYLDGKRLEITSPFDAIQNGIALLTEDRNRQGLILDMSVRENITLSNLSALTKGHFISREKERNVVNKFVRDLRIKTPSIKQIVRNLSGGTRQKVVLARWMFTESKIIIFDEPTRGIDVGAKLEIYHLINNLIERGIAVVMISSELPEIMGMCDRIAVMCRGRIAGIVDRTETTQEEIMLLATGGGD
jgi:ribose transport system ATP-binding protein